jgi:hypothetical protein
MKRLAIFLLLIFFSKGGITQVYSDYADIVQKYSKEIFMVDLKNFLNWSYDDREEKVGWIIAFPDMDVVEIPKGSVKFCGVPFYIYSPEENDGKCLICVGYSIHQLLLSLVSFKVGPIPVNKKANRLFFLHSSGWVSVKKGEPIGTYRIIYKDGKEKEIKIRIGYEIEDWWKTNKNLKLENGEVGWTTFLKSYNKEVGICVSMWENPYPEKEIKEIIIEGSGNAMLFVFAITGIKE